MESEKKEVQKSVEERLAELEQRVKALEEVVSKIPSKDEIIASVRHVTKNCATRTATGRVR